MYSLKNPAPQKSRFFRDAGFSRLIEVPCFTHTHTHTHTHSYLTCVTVITSITMVTDTFSRHRAISTSCSYQSKSIINQFDTRNKKHTHTDFYNRTKTNLSLFTYSTDLVVYTGHSCSLAIQQSSHTHPELCSCHLPHDSCLSIQLGEKIEVSFDDNQCM